MKPKNDQQKRKIRGPREANEEKRSEVKQKKKVETCVTARCVTFKPKNFEFWLLHILKFWKLIFCIWNRRLTRKCFLVSFCSWEPGSFKNMFFGKISRGKLVNTFISNYGHMFYLLLKLTAVNHTGFIQIIWSNIHNFFQTFFLNNNFLQTRCLQIFFFRKALDKCRNQFFSMMHFKQ